MLKTYRTFARTALTAALLAATSTLPASAAGLTLWLQQWNPATPTQQSVKVLMDNPAILDSALDRGWTNARDQVCERISAGLGRADGIGKGYTGYRIECVLAERGTLTLSEAGTGRFNLSYAIPGNYLSFNVTQPSVLGSYADPRFSVRYSLTVNYLLQVNRTAPFFTLVDSTATTGDVLADTHNAAGDAVKLLAWISGVPFNQMMSEAINNQKITMPSTSREIDGLTASFKGLVGNARTAGTWVRNGQVLINLQNNVEPAKYDSPIYSQVRWDSSYGADYVDCDKLIVRNTYQSGPAPLLDPWTKKYGKAPKITLTSSGATYRIGGDGTLGCMIGTGGMPQAYPYVAEPSLARAFPAPTSQLEIARIRPKVIPPRADGVTNQLPPKFRLEPDDSILISDVVVGAEDFDKIDPEVLKTFPIVIPKRRPDSILVPPVANTPLPPVPPKKKPVPQIELPDDLTFPDFGDEDEEFDLGDFVRELPPTGDRLGNRDEDSKVPGNSTKIDPRVLDFELEQDPPAQTIKRLGRFKLPLAEPVVR